MQTLNFPLTKSSNNTFNRSHWRGKHALNKDIKESVLWSAVDQKIKKVRSYPVHLFFTFYFTGRLIDVDNCGSMVKSAIDGLRDAEIVRDDSPKFVRPLTIDIKKSDTDHDYCVIEIP